MVVIKVQHNSLSRATSIDPWHSIDLFPAVQTFPSTCAISICLAVSPKETILPRAMNVSAESIEPPGVEEAVRKVYMYDLHPLL